MKAEKDGPNNSKGELLIKMFEENDKYLHFKTMNLT